MTTTINENAAEQGSGAAQEQPEQAESLSSYSKEPEHFQKATSFGTTISKENHSNFPVLKRIFFDFVKQRRWVVSNFNGSFLTPPATDVIKHFAFSDGPDTWKALSAVEKCCEKNPRCRPSISLLASNLCVFALDDVRDDLGRIEPRAQEIIDRVNSYTEISRSGHGIHIVCIGKKPGRSWKQDKFEVYDGGNKKFITLTGNVLGNREIINSPPEGIISNIYHKYFPPLSDHEVISRCSNAENKEKFETLFRKGDVSDYGNDDSSEDRALVRILAFYTQDEEQIFRIFRESALYKNSGIEKKGSRTDYNKNTIRDELFRLERTWRPPLEETCWPPQEKNMNTTLPNNTISLSGATQNSQVESLNSDSASFVDNSQGHREEIRGKKLPYELEQECLAEMAEQGFPFEGAIRSDGKVHRFSADGDKKSEDEWYIASSGVSARGNPWLICTYASWSDPGKKHTFRSWKASNGLAPLSQGEMKEMEERAQALRKEADKQEKKEREERIKKAQEAWKESTDRPNAAQAYLNRKQVAAHGVRFRTFGFDDGTREKPKWVQYETLVIPLRDIEGNILSVQHIRTDGLKRTYGPKRGAFHLLGEIGNDRRIYVTEGYATGASIRKVSDNPVVIAIDCGNLDPVVADLRKKYPKTQIVIAGDDDVEKEKNQGRKKAEAAARKYGCKVAFPKFPDGALLPENQEGERKRPTDWNDLLVHFGGAEEIKRQLSKIDEQASTIVLTFTQEELKQALADNECGDAALFRKAYGKDYVYDPDDKLFYSWNGTFWIVDKDKTRHQKLEAIATQYASEAELVSSSLEEDDKTGKKLLKDLRDRAKQLKTTRRMGSVLEMATIGSVSNGGLSFDGIWDNCIGFLPCRNGLVDLKTGSLVTSGRNHYIRKNSPLNYNASAKCPMFERFVLEIMGGRIPLAQYLQRLFGYMSIGRVIEHIFVFLHGKIGRNGKGTIIRLISKALGHLARSFSAELLLIQRNPPASGSARPDLINLAGTRLALFSEINEGRKLDTAALKTLSGGDEITARGLFEKEKGFMPTHTLVFQANHKPQAPADDTALWSRARLIPFDVTFKEDPDPKNEHERPIDIHLEEKIEKTEMPGILRWIVEGAIEYQKNGLRTPKEVLAEVEKYRNENDGIATFLARRCDFYPELSAKCMEMRIAIKNFCAEENFRIPTKNQITDYLISHGFTKQGCNDGDRWLKISIKTED